jgi:uncharacterized protein (DUF1800 family)
MRALTLGFPAAAFLCLATTARAVLDVNTDQMSDVWQSRFAAQAFAPLVDSDGDGFTNLQESILGTDPRDPASRLEASTATALPGGGLRLDWTTLRHKRHRLESSADLVNWSPVATVEGDGAARGDVVASTGSRLFVRVRAEDADADGDGLSDWEERTAGFDPLRAFSEGLGSNPTTPTTGNPRITDFERLRTLLAGPSQTVTVAALDPAMAENWPDPGVVVVRRTGRLDPLTVNLTLGGTATPGLDYGSPGLLSVTIPFGADEAYFSLTPLADAVGGEGSETITVTAQPGAGYTLGAATVATLTITDAADGRLAEKAAARFLAQASFGQTPVELARVRQLGFAGWLDAQFARPLNLHLPIVQTWQAELFDPLDPTDSAVGSDHRIEAWWRQTIRDDVDSDPLRQRVAFALSQIFVISDRMTSLGDDQRGMTSYQDTLLAHSFGNYRDLLEAVTRHPWMGLYLSALRNRKANPSINRFPDENYAREVMQLFSIGLWLLNPDGSLRLSTGADLDPDGVIVPAGQPIPTYGETQIGVLARVFTGLSYSTRFTGNTNIAEIPTTRFNDSNNVPWHPMRMWDVEHDVATKTFFMPGHGTLVLPARTASASPDTGVAGDADLDAALDFLAAHPNVGPFVCRQLIQRLVTSNPTPAYLARISAVFANNGSGVRGDLRAVIRALLLDPEARDFTRLADPTHGLVREPYTRYVALARALGATPGPDAAPAPGAARRFRGFGGVDGDFLQRPLSAPSVFNFYSPAYQPPGPVGALGLVAPELQIVNSVTAITGPNRFSSALSASSSTGLTRFNSTSYTDDAATTERNEADYNTRADEAAWQPIGFGDPDALVAALDRALCAGAMTPVTFRSVARAVRRLDDPNAPGLATDVSEQRARMRFRIAAHLVALSADAAVLK